jgi:hypothetical protein
MKANESKIFRTIYSDLMERMSKVKGFDLTLENQIHIGLTILCQLYENKRVTEGNLKEFFSELSDFFTGKKLDISFGYVLKNIHPSHHMITAEIWRGKRMSAKTLNEIFKDLSDYCFKKKDEINEEKFKFIMTDYDTMNKHNIKMIHFVVDAA